MMNTPTVVLAITNEVQMMEQFGLKECAACDGVGVSIGSWPNGGVNCKKCGGTGFVNIEQALQLEPKRVAQRSNVEQHTWHEIYHDDLADAWVSRCSNCGCTSVDNFSACTRVFYWPTGWVKPEVPCTVSPPCRRLYRDASSNVYCLP